MTRNLFKTLISCIDSNGALWSRSILFSSEICVRWPSCDMYLSNPAVWCLNQMLFFKCSALSGSTSAEQTDFSEKWANAGLDVGGTIILRRMRGSGAYFRIWSARQRSTDLMSDTLLTAIIEGQIITGYQSDVEHSHASLLRGWGLQQTSIRQCERSTGRGNVLMTVTKLVLWFHHIPFASSFFFISEIADDEHSAQMSYRLHCIPAVW